MHNLGDLNLVNLGIGEICFKDSPLPVSKDIGSHDFPIVGKTINNFLPNNREHRVCVNKKKMKNLVATAQTKQRDAGATRKSDIRGKIFELAWKLKRDGRSEETVKSYVSRLNWLTKRGAQLMDPEDVKKVIACAKGGVSHKRNISLGYKCFAAFMGIQYEQPNYKPERKIPFIPLESEIDALIAGCGPKTATLLQLLKDTGMRIGEAAKLRWTDLDVEHHVVNVNAPGKGSNARSLKTSRQLVAMLNKLPKKNQYVFGGVHPRSSSVTFSRQRRKLAAKLENPRLMQIHFHTLRHWKATMEYQKTKNILYVKQLLGHKSIENTLLYTQLVNFESNEYHPAVAKTVDEAKNLIEAGFEYVCHHNDVMLFRKRK